jgi:hypothetical protein
MKPKTRRAKKSQRKIEKKEGNKKHPKKKLSNKKIVWDEEGNKLILRRNFPFGRRSKPRYSLKEKIINREEQNDRETGFIKSN